MNIIRSADYNFSVEYSLNGVRKRNAVFPIHNELVIQGEYDRGKNRKKLSGGISFVNSPVNSIYDYSLFKEIDTTCCYTKIDFFIRDKENTLLARGFFSPYDMKFDDDRCVCETQVQCEDEYTCIDKIADNEYNMLELTAPGEAFYIYNPGNFELFECEKEMIVSTMNTTASGCITFLDQNAFGLPYTIFDIYQNLAEFYANFVPLPYLGYELSMNTDCIGTSLFSIIEKFKVIRSEYTFISWSSQWNHYDPQGVLVSGWRAKMKVKTTWGLEMVTTVDNPLTGPVSPGAGYVQYQTGLTVAGLACTKWCREPYYNNQSYGYYKTTNNCHYIVYDLINPYSGIGIYETYIYRGRRLMDVLQALVDQSECELIVESQFFQNELNPITGTANCVKHLMMNQASDMTDPDSTEPARIMNVKLSELLDELETLFNVWWHIDGNKFILEHRSYYDNGYSYSQNNIIPIDLTGKISRYTGKTEINRTNSYEYAKENIYRYEKWVNTYFKNIDYDTSVIDYQFETATKKADERTNTHDSRYIIDLAAYMADPTSYPQQGGIVLVAIQYTVIDPQTNLYGYSVIDEQGLRSGEMVQNGHLCLSNLIPAYWRYGATISRALINNVEYDMITMRRLKKQTIKISDCDRQYDTTNLYTTTIGTGIAEAANFSLIRKVTELNILL